MVGPVSLEDLLIIMMMIMRMPWEILLFWINKMHASLLSCCLFKLLMYSNFSETLKYKMISGVSKLSKENEKEYVSDVSELSK